VSAADQDVTGPRAAATMAVRRASQILLARQDGQGWWSGRSAGDVTLVAEALLVREILGTRTAEATNVAAQQLRSLQQADGRWTGSGESAAEGDGPAAAGDLSATVLAYLALRLAGDSADAYHMAVAAGWIRDAGGVAAAGVFAQAWLATFGLAEWTDIPVPAPELIYLPGRYAASRPDRAFWGRPAGVALTIIATLRPSRPLPFKLGELRAGELGPAAADPRARTRRPALTVAQSAALRKCGQWLIGWQHRSGLPASRRPCWPCSLVALHLLGYPLDHPVLAKGLSWLDEATAQSRLAAGSPRPEAVRPALVLDTTLAIEALADSSVAANHAALVAAAGWLLLQRIEGPADRGGVASGPEPAGWSFGRDGYPVVADTARVLLALTRVELPGRTGRPAVRNAIRWLTGMQSRDGSWSASVVVTAHVVRALATHGAPDSRVLRRGVVWLLRHQLPDGSWADAHGPVTGGPVTGGPVTGDLGVTATVLPALLVAGVLPGKPPIRAAVDWVLSQQNLDAGWASGARAGGSEAAATARAVTALLAAGGAETIDSVDLAADWLVRAQQPDGGWSDEPARKHGSGRMGDAHGGDRANASGRPNGRPSGRSSPRRRGPLVPGLLLPLGALGQYVAAGVADEDENDEATAVGSARVDEPRADGSRMADRLPAE
jgi:squalene-hopene/tetraprenyl-beta-curcumene cyclase